VEIMDWDVAVRRAVAVVTGPGEPGRYFLFDEAAPDRPSEINQKTPWLSADIVSPAEPLEFVTTAGVTLTGHLTLPRQPRVARPPLVVLCPDLPGWRDHGGFARDAQALASAGFAVLKVDYRGVSGFGRARRDAAKEAFDRVPLDDLRAAIDWVAARHPVDRSRVALVGRNFGGYLALRALELYSKEFRAAVTFDAPTDLSRWLIDEMNGAINVRENIWDLPITAPGLADRRRFFGSDRAKLDPLSALKNAEAVMQPVLIFEMAGISGHGLPLFTALQKRGVAAEYVEVKRLPHRPEFLLLGERDPPFPPADSNPFYNSPATFARINAFLMAHLYDFDVKIGSAKTVE
jgi:dipeptidyl aminopeptidase/acylaminoacyl peptidase